MARRLTVIAFVLVLLSQPVVHTQTPVTYRDFRVTFRSLVATRKPTGVYLQADDRVPYGDVVRVLAVVRGAGVQNVGLVAADESTP